LTPFSLAKRLAGAGGLAAALLALPHTALAQGAPAPGGGFRNALSLNPLAIPFEIVSVEFETKLASAFSLGISGGYFSPDVFTLSSVDVRLKLYPNEEGPKGFAVGLSFGLVHLRDRSCCSFIGDEETISQSFPAAGVFLDYNWLVGKSKRMLVGTGVGAKRLLGNDDRFDVGTAYPTARLQLGWIF
jgi:hypothetical protein